MVKFAYDYKYKLVISCKRKAGSILSMKTNKTKIFKKTVCVIFALLLSFNSFAAAVSDNDGSAFITKSEFDSLKNNFQAQIDRYNTSIDMKIDSAIASYLSGIRAVASEPSKVLVDNYSDMMWVGDYNIYGRWKKWTSNTAMTSDMNNKWFTPSLNEKRHTFRSPNGSYYSSWTQAWTQQTTYFEFMGSTFSNGVCVARYSEWARNNESGVPTFIMQLKEDDDGNWVVDRPVNIYALSAHSMSSDHTQSGTTGTDAYAWGNSRWWATGIEILDKEATDIIKFKVSAQKLGSTATSTYIDRLTPANFPFPCTWCDDYGHNAGGGFTDKFDTQTQVYSTSTGITTSNYFSTGCTWNKIDTSSANVQFEFLRNMMLGRTNSQQVNAAYFKVYRGERGQYDFTKSSTSGTMSGKITNLATYNSRGPIQSDGITTTNTTVDVSTSFSVPHWPTENLKDLTSGRFVYNGKGLKYGEGFPLRIDNQTNGYLQISFDSSCEGINNGGKLSSQDLRIDMRKENFLSSTTNWAQGYKGLVNPDSTSEALVTLGGYRYTTTDGKINLTVPMKKDESLWIRICPWDNTKGYCAKWSNLNMTMNVN